MDSIALTLRKPVRVEDLTLELRDVTVETIEECPFDPGAYPSGFGIEFEIYAKHPRIGGETLRLNSTSDSCGDDSFVWWSPFWARDAFKLHLVAVEDVFRTPTARVLVWKLGRVKKGPTELEISPGACYQLAGGECMLYKRCVSGGRGSPLIVYLEFTTASMREQKEYHLGYENGAEFCLERYRFKLQSHEHDSSVRLVVTTYEMEQMASTGRAELG